MQPSVPSKTYAWMVGNGSTARSFATGRLPGAARYSNAIMPFGVVTARHTPVRYFSPSEA